MASRIRRLAARGLVWGCLVCSLLARPALAQSGSAPMPLGGRSTLMGGTGVALGRDGSTPFLNPAAMGRISDTRLAFSVRFYRYSRTTVDSLIRIPEGTGSLRVEDYDQQSLAGVPSSFCAFITLSGLIPEEASGLLRVVRGKSGRTKLGICGATIEREGLSLTAEHRRFETGDGVLVANADLERSWSRSVLGPSVSYQLTDRLTLGASMHVVSTAALERSSLSILSDSPAYAGQPGTYLDERHASSWDGMTTLGATYGWQSLTTGVSLRLPSVHFADSARATSFEQSGAAPSVLRAGSGDYSADLPVVLTLGTGLDWPGTSLEFDVAATWGGPLAYETEIDDQSYSGHPLGLETRRSRSRIRGRSAVAFRTGGEWSISPSLSILAGLRYEPSRVVTSSDSYAIAPSDGSLLGSAIGLGSYGRGTELLFGTELSYGWARIPVPDPSLEGSGRVITHQRTWSALLVLSGSVGLSSVKQTWRNFKDLRDQHDQRSRRADPPHPRTSSTP